MSKNPSVRNGGAAVKTTRGPGRPKTVQSPAAVSPDEGDDDRQPDASMSQTDAALDKIRSSIIDLTIAPGSRIDESLLLDKFMLGRTPAREAISRLVAEGFVNIAAKRGGTFVRKLDFAEICEICAAQQISENILANLCQFDDPNLVADLQAIQDLYRDEVNSRRFLNITALNEQFHMRMNRSIHNSFFFEFAKSTHRHIRRLLVYLYTLESPEPTHQEEQFRINLDEHDRIIDVLRRKDRETLITLLREHARATQDRFMWILQKQTVPPFEISLKPLTQPLDLSTPAPTKTLKAGRKPAPA